MVRQVQRQRLQLLLRRRQLLRRHRHPVGGLVRPQGRGRRRARVRRRKSKEALTRGLVSKPRESPRLRVDGFSEGDVRMRR